MGMLDFLKRTDAPRQDLEKPAETVKMPLEKQLKSLSGQGRATVVFNSRKKAEKMSFPGVPWNSIGRYIDGVVRGEEKEFVRRKSSLDFETTAILDSLIEKEVDKILY